MIFLGQECGRQFSNETLEEASRRIVGGQACSVSRWPWQVALIANGEQVCGGSLVTPDWIVTAAHCFDSGLPVSFTYAKKCRHLPLENAIYNAFSSRRQSVS